MGEWLANQIVGVVVGLLTTGVWAAGVYVYYRRQRRSKELLAWFALKSADERLLRNVSAAIDLLGALREGRPESKTARKAVSADLSDMELRLTRNLAALPAEWVTEHLPFRDARGVVWANDIHFVTDGVRELVDALAAMRRDLEKEEIGTGGLGLRAEPWIERAATLREVIGRQLKLVPAEAAALSDD